MEIKELLIKIAEILGKLKIDYVITGGMAVSVWGRPRATFDIDIIIQLKKPDIRKLARAFRAFDEAAYVDEEAMMQALEKKREFNFIHSATQLKIDFWIAGDAIAIDEIKRGISKKIDSQNIKFISPEDLILSKLRWYEESQSTRHLEDIESILKISGDKLDMKYLKNAAEWQNTKEILDKILDKIAE